MPEPWVSFEDEHILVVDKPAGVNTHRADVHGQDGMYEWVQRCRPGVALSVLHRLDKGTSGLLLFGKSAAANRSLAPQFEDRRVAKRYELLVHDDPGGPGVVRCEEPIPGGRGGRAPLEASTDFVRRAAGPNLARYDAYPHTGRTHQVRLHAAALGMPVVGDGEHSGIVASRLFLHAAGLGFDHPTAGRMDLVADRPGTFDLVLAGSDPNLPAVAALAAHEARAHLFDDADTDAYLWIDRHHDGFGGVRVEYLAGVALVVNYGDPAVPLERGWLDAWGHAIELRAIYEQRRPRGGGGGPATLVSGRAGPHFEVHELGLSFIIDLEASVTSTGLFLDHRETRRRLAGSDMHAKTVLNVFAHTGSLSVAAASAGAETLSLDLSRRYLDWTRENLRANGIDPGDHDFIFGDALDWMARLAKKGRVFDLVIVDPPSSSTGAKRGGSRWLVERDLHLLVSLAANLCAPDGTIFVSTNLRRMTWTRFLGHIEDGLASAGRAGEVETQTLPLDHRSGPGDPPYLKAAWITLTEVMQSPGSGGPAPAGGRSARRGLSLPRGGSPWRVGDVASRRRPRRARR